MPCCPRPAANRRAAPTLFLHMTIFTHLTLSAVEHIHEKGVGIQLLSYREAMMAVVTRFVQWRPRQRLQGAALVQKETRP
ncbi:hypothetical protein BDV96DRAFT_369367 [Lophiotrema nucula]|uniref:Uncharacterized protein n=1 Tax=Lophiotrema nucula TaxID=690887 RepID=A0A6A5ZJJ7_9PLEO|nr:hypothetical protein BDV96DRAFT_369367 [Lophiotrema nucula]